MATTQRTPPEKSTQTLLKPTLLTQESDTASDCIGSETECVGQRNITRRYKRGYDESMLNELKDMLADVQLQQKSQASKFNEEMQKLMQQNAKITESIQYMSDKYDEVLRQLQQTKSENSAFKTQIKTLEQKLETFERNSKASTLELKNVPESNSEDTSALIELVRSVGDVLNVKVLDTDIRTIYRTKKIPNKSAPIIVEFSSNSIKENIIMSSKKYNKDKNNEKLNSTHLKLIGEKKPIFIAESLTTCGRKLYYMARQYVKNHRGASCWTAYGRVYMRQKEGGPSILISREEDFFELKTQ
ncbi:hypothetical protein PYW07_001836 [Mythimna separata]|uniref:Zinc finger DNA binding protein n=1 Tax=Mythimna separata TaxID=271217 RepID=A0AAD7YVP2_MYTSE|nr:hypothetical protein PYW07_001836 [Mythimna separata]